MGDKSKKGQRFLVVVTVISVLIIATVLTLVSVQQGGLSQKMAAARKVGFPFEGKDLAPKTKFTENQNAAHDYLRAAVLDKAASASKTTGRSEAQKFPGIDMTPSDEAALRQYLTDNAAMIDQFQIGAAKPYCYFQKDWDNGANVLLPEYASMKSVSRAVLARAHLRATGGDIEGAVSDFESVQRTSRHLASQPVLIGMMVSVALEAMQGKTIERLLPAATKDKQLSAALQTQVNALTQDWDLTNGLKGEAFLNWWCTDHLSDLSGMSGYFGSNEPLPMKLTKNSQTAARALKSAILEIYTPALHDYKPYGDASVVFNGIDRRANKAKAESLLARPFLEILIPVWGQLPSTLDKAKARKLLLLAALDVIEYRRSKGTWPKSLADTGGSYLDPFDVKPLRYKTEGQGFRVWSVGINGKDDGGKTREETRTDDHDEVIVYPPTPRNRPPE